MTESSALLRGGVNRIADAAGVLLFGALLLVMYFGVDVRLEQAALLLGLVAGAAAWTEGVRPTELPRPLLLYAFVGLVAAGVHRAMGPDPRFIAGFAGAFHLIVMVVFIYGATYLLRTRERLSAFVVLVTLCSLVLALQIFFDRASTAFVSSRAGAATVPQWAGVHGASLVLTMALPFPLAMLLTARTLSPALAGAVLTVIFFGVAYVNESKGGMVAMATMTIIMSVVVQLKRRRWLTGLAMLLIVAAAIAGAAVLAFRGRTWLIGINFLSNRDSAWLEAIQLFLTEPVIGVGPGNYLMAMYTRGWGGAFPNAHNWYLHEAAETGAIGLLALAILLLWLVRAAWRAWQTQRYQVMALGLLGALFGLLAHSVTENFLGARAEVERTRLLIWAMFAAMIALSRLIESERRA